MNIDKDYILQEIRRTANDGKPLGEKRFHRETGMTSSDWKGKYWARWGDALQEAGFPRNEFQGPIAEEILFSKYIGLVRELNRLPVKAELLLKARTDPTFPCPRPFGRKADFIRRLIVYCQEHSEYEDVARLCHEYAPFNENIPDRRKCSDDQIGFVYLLKSGRFYKIGKTNAVGRREYEVGLQLPEKPYTSFERMTQVALKPTGTNVLKPNGRMANGLNSKPRISQHSNVESLCSLFLRPRHGREDAAMPPGIAEITISSFCAAICRHSQFLYVASRGIQFGM